MTRYAVIFVFLFSVSFISCKEESISVYDEVDHYAIMVLGIAQDAGFPQANCQKACCSKAWDDYSLRKMTSCLAVIDVKSQKYWIFDATPDFKDQIRLVQQKLGIEKLPEAIFLTHAHIGHYTGLMQLGHEVMGASAVPVFAMPRMKEYLEQNGPWSQLVSFNNIKISPLTDGEQFAIGEGLHVRPFLVPHRDEYSETVGFEIKGPEKTAIFIPDIDKWDRWHKNIVEYIESVDLAYLDATFFEDGEIPGRSMTDIPHPFIEESMDVFRGMEPYHKEKVHFIHLNHTNPVLDSESTATLEVHEKGFDIAVEGKVYKI